jgi:uncharacterized protein YdaU (DUF1376 family)
MSKAPSMPLFCGDYLSDTKHLTLEQHGAYLVLLMVTWRNNGKAIKDDPDLLARYLGCTRDRWLKKIRPILEPMFDLSDGAWRSEKLEKQWAYVQKAIAVKRQNGKLGGRPTAGKPDENSEKCTDETVSIIGDDHRDNLLENNETDKATGSFSVNLSETNHPQPLLHSEVKKEDSPPPPSGGQESDLFGEPASVQAATNVGKSKRQRSARFTEAQLMPFFERFAAVYPPNDEREGHAFKTANSTILRLANHRDHPVEPEAVIAAAARYAQAQAAKGKVGTQFIMKPNNWLCSGEWKKYDGVHHLTPRSSNQSQNHQRRPAAAGVRF